MLGRLVGWLNPRTKPLHHPRCYFPGAAAAAVHQARGTRALCAERGASSRRAHLRRWARGEPTSANVLGGCQDAFKVATDSRRGHRRALLRAHLLAQLPRRIAHWGRRRWVFIVPDGELRPRLVPRLFTQVHSFEQRNTQSLSLYTAPSLTILVQGMSTRGRQRNPKPLRHGLLVGAAQPAGTAHAASAAAASLCRAHPTTALAATAPALPRAAYPRRRAGLAGRLPTRLVRAVQKHRRRLRCRKRGRPQRAARLGRAVRGPAR